MNTSQTDLDPLLREISRGNCVPFLGAAGNGQVPGPRQLAERLAAEIGYSGQDLADVAQRYALQQGIRALRERVREWLGSPQLQPGPIHLLLARLPFSIFLTTAQHNLLEMALRAAGRPVTPVIDQEETAVVDRARATVIKLFGDVTRPESLILTEKEHETVLQRSHLVTTVVQATLATNTLLFLEYDLADWELRSLFYQAVQGQGRNKRSAYAVWPQPDEYLQRRWAEENLRFIDSEPVAFLQTVHRELDRMAPSPGPVAPRPAEPPLDRRPFRFLDAFRPVDADLFCGREKEITSLSEKILAHRLVVLTGASGTGKTSLLLAGVGPRLAAEDWRMVLARPLDDPFTALQRALAPLSGDLPAETTLRGLLLAAETATDERLVVVLDQFEEFFMRLGSEAQNSFIAKLAPCLADPEVDARFVLSLRNDFFLRLGAFEAQMPEIFYNVFVLNRLRHEQALEAVLEPLRQVKIELELGLAERIVNDLDERGVDPPQLQIVCDRLYDDMLTRGSRHIAVADYERLGGIQELLPAYLSDVLARLPQAKPVLESLVGDGGLKTMRSLPEIEDRVGDEVDDLPTVLESLVDARLVRAVREDEAVHYELVHDVLAAAIWEWLSEGAREAERARGILERGLSDWQSSEALLDAQRLDFVAVRWPFLEAVDGETQALLLRSVVRAGDDVSAWFQRLTDTTLNRQVLLEMSEHPDPGTRARAVTYLADEIGVTDDDDPALAALRRVSVQDPETEVRRAATLALHRARGDAAITYLASQAQAGDLAARSHALGGLALLGDSRVRIWPHLSGGLRPVVAAGVARLRLVRHWPHWGWRVAGATAGGALGLALGFALLFLFTVGRLDFFVASYGLPFGAVAGLGCGLGIALAAALADGDRRGPRAAGGALGGALGYAVGLQLMQSAFGLGTNFPYWLVGLLVGALVGLGLGLSPVAGRWAGFQVIGGAAAGALGFIVAWLLSWLEWPPFLALLTGVIVGGMVGAGLAWADRRSARDMRSE
jgi:hypothetical protein